jgi:glucuronate isomerase
MLHEHRLFPVEGAARAVAAKLYEMVRDLPIISPHGHTDPQWFAENKPFANPTALFLQPDHYIFRMLYSQGISMESLGVPQAGSKGDPAASARIDPLEAWRIFAKHYYLFRGTPTRMWLDYAFSSLFGLTELLQQDNADAFYETIDKALKTPDFLPRALFERCRIEVLAPEVAPADQGFRMGRPRVADVSPGCCCGRRIPRLP